MSWEAWVTVGTVIMLLVALARGWGPTDVLVLISLTFLIAVGAVMGTDKLPTAVSAVREFGNPGLVTVGMLFAVVAGLSQTGALSLIAQPLLGRPKTLREAQFRLLLPASAASAFLNNTPIVAMFLPVVSDLCRKTGLSASKLYLPLCYATTLGGICTLIGTSTNLVVHGMMVSAGLPVLGLFDLAWVGVPGALAGLAYILTVSRRVLPDREPVISLHGDPRHYTVEMLVQANGPLVGRSIEQAGLRHLPGLYLLEIQRGDEILPAVGSRERLQADDRVVFVGVVESVVDLQKIRGLVPAAAQAFSLETPHSQRCLIEAVVSDRCPLIGQTIRDGGFRSVYNAAVVAVARAGERLRGKLGDVVLAPGDTLLLEGHRSFADQQRNSSHFFLVSNVENSTPIRHDRAWVALTVLAAMVAAVTLTRIDMLVGAMLAAAAMIGLRCCSPAEARQSVDWSVLLAIGASIGIGQALDRSGAAQHLSSQIISLAGGHPWLVLAAVYVVTMVCTEMITNNAAAVLVFPIAMSAAKSLAVSTTPFAVCIMVAASGGFATPFGYQTNMMVFGPGGYRFSDYLRFGIPLDLILMTVTVLLVPLIWAF